MEKDHFNDKVLDKEKALSVIKTSYLNSYKVIVAGARDFANYAYMKKKQKTSVNNLRHFFVSLQHKKSSKREKSPTIISSKREK